MIVLGIESTAHTFSASILDDSDILSLESDMFTTIKGGLIPRDVAEHHINVCGRIIQAALEKANKKITDVELISFSQSPGIGTCLEIGALCAKALSQIHNIPIVGVNHCIAHLEIARLLTGFSDPVMLYTSGANTQVIAYQEGRYRVFGETLDMGVGNFLDQFGRLLKLGFPAGKKIEELAKKGSKYIELPYSVKGMDVSFGGLFTNLSRMFEKYKVEDLCFSVEETVFAELVEVTERALAHCMKNELVVTGGVGCNARLQEMCNIMCKDRLASFKPLPAKFAVDNAAMIAWAGILKYNVQKKSDSDLTINQRTRTEQVEVTWR
ncbi:tRNA N6-adenosine threonylcarbamoyltransferase [Candidatus Tiddalikarchaeum anstoanum]|nr:tRNA N6-adenosine threonylcarbamoyltransferase [Candidatus Tiddalikarchaeum anstoanum]